MTLETHHMNVTYNASDRTYTILMAAEYAHVLIWGGSDEDLAKAKDELIRSLIAAEDEQMPTSQYHEMFA